MKSERVLAIDIFRGLTIFTMVFVNDLASVANMPQWMKHYPADVSGMSFVDVVFPAFLFIVGMAIPLAIEKRLSKNPNQLAFWRHVILRTLGLLVLGVYMVNSAEMDVEASLIPKYIWAPLLYIAAVLIWNRYPKTEDAKKRKIQMFLKILGIIILITLYFLYRKTQDGQLIGMTPSWWGILGLIGWAYLGAVIIFLLARKQLLPLILATAVLIVLHLFIWGYPNAKQLLPNIILGNAGDIAHTIITLAGVICTLLLQRTSESNRTGMLPYMLLMGVIMALTAYFTTPFGGISKIGATPSWTLYSAAICCFIFPFVYWLVDVRGLYKWANFLKPAGVNPLLTYIIPPFIYGILGFTFLPAILNTGIPGLIRAIVFSILILWIAKWLTKKGIRLQL